MQLKSTYICSNSANKLKSGMGPVKSFLERSNVVKVEMLDNIAVSSSPESRFPLTLLHNT